MEFNKDQTHQHAGFTLLEMLISLFIFTLISVIAFASLNQVRLADHRVGQSISQLKALQTALRRMERDLSQMTLRAVRSENGDTLPAIITKQDANEFYIEFTRSGVDPVFNQNKTDLMRVAYYLENNKLYRRVWLQLDRTRDTPVETYVILNDIDSIELTFLDDQGTQQAQWPANASASPTLPRVLDLKIELKQLGTLERLIEIKDVVQ